MYLRVNATSDDSSSLENVTTERVAEQRRELLEELARAQQQAAAGIAAGRSLTKSNQRMMDFLEALRPIAETAPSLLFRDPLFIQITGGLREYRLNFDTAVRDASVLAMRIQTTVSSTISTASVTVTSTDWPASHGFATIEPLLMLQQQELEPQTVLALLSHMQLDEPRGERRSPVDLLKDAERSLAITASDADYGAGVTVPLREAIHTVVDELLKRRPITSKVGSGLGEKISALASQCGRATNTRETIARVAETASRLVNELSGTKNKTTNRQRVRTLFVQGLGVLKNIVDLIDPNKLRPS